MNKPSLAVANDWADKHWKSVLGLVVAVLTAWFGLQSQVLNKVDKPELTVVEKKLDAVHDEVRDLRDDVDMVVRYICLREAASLGCQPRSRSSRDDR